MSPSPRKYTIDYAVEVENDPGDDARMTEAVKRILDDADFESAQISIAIVDDEAIHDLNRRYLDHDYPTDVLSFTLAEEGSHLEGQLVVSIDTAAAQAAEYGWRTEDELLLYVVHGTLHLVGYDDATPELRADMQTQECRVLEPFGLAPRYDATTPTEPPQSPSNASHESTTDETILADEKETT